MRPTFYGFEIAKTALFSSQKNLDITGHNIANANTTGYTRQRLVSGNIPPYNTMTRLKDMEVGKVGAGVEALSLDQIRDEYLDRRMRNHNALDAYWSERNTGLGEIESVLNGELGANKSSLSALMDDFFASVNKLTTDKDSTDLEFRTNVLIKGRQLTQSLHDIYTRMEELLYEHDMRIGQANAGMVAQVNNIAHSIGEYNRQIYAFEINGERALDLRDQRNLLIDELSTLVDIDYHEDGSSKLHISIGGRELVNHVDITGVKAVRNGYNALNGKQNDLYTMTWEDGALVNLTGGKIKAHMDIRDGVQADPAAGQEAINGIVQYMEQLNLFARTIAEQFNNVHKLGYTQPHQTNGGQSVQGILFFHVDNNVYGTPDYSSVNAGNIRVSDAIDTDLGGSVYNIAISSNPITDPPDGGDVNERANQEIALRLVRLGTESVQHIGPIKSYLSSFLGGVGSDKMIAKERSSEYASITHELSQMWASYSGVSKDEEMTNLIRFNHAYTAASRNITAIDEQLDVLINRMGRVGL